MSVLTKSKDQKQLKQEAVKAYAQAGFTLFPLVTESRTPRKGDKWKETPYSSNPKLPDTFGVILPPEIWVADADPRRYVNGRNELAELCEYLNLGRQETCIVRSGRGGYHIYFRKPADFKLRGKVPGFPAIDVKQFGGYVVAAGSMHPNGTQYEFERHDPFRIIDTPPQLLEYLKKPEWEGDDGIESDDESTRQRFITYLLYGAPPAIEGNSGNKTTYFVACEGKVYGLPQQSVYELMSEYYNYPPKCVPEWDENQLEAIVAHAFQYSQEVQGARHGSADFIQVAAQDQANKQMDYQHPLSTAPVKPSPDELYIMPNWDWEIDKAGIKRLKKVLGNIVSYMRVKHVTDARLKKEFPNPLRNMLKFNLLSREIEFIKPAPWHHPKYPKATWTDFDAILMKNWLADIQHFDVPVNLIHEAAFVESWNFAYSPIVDWLENLEPWDGHPRIDLLMPYYADSEDTEYTRTVGRITLIGLVARALDPGCQHDTVMVMEGEQGTRKTTFCRVLGGKWYGAPTLKLKERDTFHMIQNLWLVELAEMRVKHSEQVDALKHFITNCEDSARFAYDRFISKCPRSCVIIGTINPEDDKGYLRDTTGNRRFLPVSTGRIRIEELQRDRNQLFAEALWRYRNGEPHHIEQEDVLQAAAEQQQQRLTTDAWQDTILLWVHKNYGKEPITSRLIATAALGILPGSLTNFDVTRIGEVMRVNGYKTKSYRSPEGIVSKCWVAK